MSKQAVMDKNYRIALRALESFANDITREGLLAQIALRDIKINELEHRLQSIQLLQPANEYRSMWFGPDPKPFEVKSGDTVVLRMGFEPGLEQGDPVVVEYVIPENGGVKVRSATHGNSALLKLIDIAPMEPPWYTGPPLAVPGEGGSE